MNQEEKTASLGEAVRANRECWINLQKMRNIQTHIAQVVSTVPGARRSRPSQQKPPPHPFPLKKVDRQTEAPILGLRKERKLGPRRLCSELERLHSISLSVSVIHKVLRRNNCKPLAKQIWKKAEYIRYYRPIPGEQIQVDTCKIAPNLYQYTVIDDCTRCRALQIYKKRNAGSTLDFLDKVLEELLFPAQCIQTDRGMEFLRRRHNGGLEYGIKFRLDKPDKAERSQKTDIWRSSTRPSI